MKFAVRQSLTGSAAHMTMYQGVDNLLEHILETLVSVSGTSMKSNCYVSTRHMMMYTYEVGD